MKRMIAGRNSIDKIRQKSGTGLGMRDCVIFGVIGFFFCFFELTGRDLAVRGNLVWTGAYVLRLLLFCLPGGVCLGIGCAFLTGLLGRMCERVSAREESVQRNASGNAQESAPENTSEGQIRKNKKRFCEKTWQFWLVCTALILLCWLPCYLAYYPGICAYDVTVQTGQIESGAYNDHHPIAHTLLLAGSMRLGEALSGEVNTGLGLSVAVQMFCLAGAFGWGLALLRRRGVSGKLLLCLLLLSMFYPFHMYMSVSVSKDVFFSVFFLLQMLALYELIRLREKGFGGFDVLFLVSALGMQLFRNNGRYAMLVLLAALAVAFVFGKGARRFWGRVLLECVVSLAVGSLLLSGLFEVTGAEQGDRREMLSMPIQQLARCMLYHGGVGALPEDDGTMEEQDKALINDFLLDESYREYRPDIADPVKRHTNTYVARYRAGDFIKTYLNLLCSYPGDFVNAALAVNAGYLYVGDESHAHINENGEDRGLGYVQTRWVEAELNPRGLYKDSKWEGLHELLERWADENAYLRLPVLRYLFVPGVFLWLYLLLFGRLAARKRYAECVPLALAGGYYLTLFLGPAVQLRYLYPLMIVLPFAAVCLWPRGGADSGKDAEDGKNTTDGIGADESKGGADSRHRY